MFISEQTDGSVIEMESRDVTFSDDDFRSRGKIDKDFQLYEMKNFDNTPTNIIEGNTPTNVIKGNTDLSQHTRPSGSVASPGELNSQEAQLHKSNRKSIPRR